jgi:hypothetical protein
MDQEKIQSAFSPIWKIFFFLKGFPDLDFDGFGSSSSSPWVPSFESRETAANE